MCLSRHKIELGQDGITVAISFNMHCLFNMSCLVSDSEFAEPARNRVQGGVGVERTV